MMRFIYIGFFVIMMMAQAQAVPTHVDHSKNPRGCSACHRGHGRPGTPMLKNNKREGICFNCHGPASIQAESERAQDIYSLFLKPYRHPVIETSQYHRQGETLPEEDPGRPRHVACEDCHNPHFSEPGKPLNKVLGHKKLTGKRKLAQEEHEVCYKCHSDSANLPADSENIHWLMDPLNPSFHPVESVGKASFVPSLIPPLNTLSRITCTDCHGNSDPFGPRGPHGSDYKGILVANYTTIETPESPSSYALCYLCHERDSILSDESFRAHKSHVVYNHIPCAGCHDPHGSRDFPSLLDFDNPFVSQSPLPNYLPSSSGYPKCYLNCHVGGRDVLHDQSFYEQRNWQ